MQDKITAGSEIARSMKKSPRGDLLAALQKRRWFFAQCVVNPQKSLLQSVVSAEGLINLKNKLDKVMEGKKNLEQLLNNLSSVMGNLCKPSDPGRVSWRGTAASSVLF